ncbi:MAG: type II secretion system protein, partial [Alphaproteobacteria bacterium]|nr:type II secretion system protein [Alphaproteobacteria bacterium]
MQKGFTLIEIAAVLLISGISMMGIARFVNIYMKSAEHKTTIENLEMAYDALEEYAGLNGYYPCPANPEAAPGDSDYGRSSCRDDEESGFNADACTNIPDGISCTTTNSRDGDNNGHKDVVMIGVLPFRDLAEKVKSTPFKVLHRVDGYGTLITYAVTERLTKANSDNNLITPFDPMTGSISVLDENLTSVMIPDKEGQFVIFSHGLDGMGGHSKEGQALENCFVPSTTGGVPDTIPDEGLYNGKGKIETENCDNNDAIFIKGILSLADNNDYYDDYLYYKGRGISALWEGSMAGDTGESYIYNTNPGGVGVGTSQPNTKLHIMGDLSSV